MNISVVIPLYNKVENIIPTMQSVLAQSVAASEIIVVDDGSSDGSGDRILGTPEFCDAISSGALRLIKKKNGGVCSARNRGIIEAKSNYIAFLDADDLWASNFLEEMAHMIEDYPEASIWSSNYAETEKGKILRDVPTGLPKGYRGIVEHYFEMPSRVSDLVCSSSVVVRKSVFEEVGYFDERIRYAEDTDMWWRIISCYPFAFVDDYLAFYQFDAENRAQKTYRRLDAYLPFYIDKYKEERFRTNTIFYRYANRWASVSLRKYYFSSRKDERLLAKQAVRKLDYSVIPLKYKYLFCRFYPVGWIFNKLDNLYHKSR